MPTSKNEFRIAKRLYKSVSNLPIISPHGHVDAKLLLENQPFSNPAELFIYFDHYVTRMINSIGHGLDNVNIKTSQSPRDAWKLLCTNWKIFHGTASGYWLSRTFSELFGIHEVPSPENSDKLFDSISSKLELPEMLPRALFSRFKIEVLATTDDPCDDLASHKALRDDESFAARVIPTFRPDSYLDPRMPGWPEKVQEIISLSGLVEVSYKNLVKALEIRREFFKSQGAVSADHGVYEPYTCKLDSVRAEEIFSKALQGNATFNEARDFTGNMLLEMARMSCNDGLVMTLHAGVLRNHSSETLQKYGPDTGHDIPVAAEFTNNLRPLLEEYGLHPNLHLILFCLDEPVWSREIATLAGFYPSVFVGAPWWFLDAPDSAMRFRESVTEISGFYKGSGFIDDTRAFLSIPARHDMARRVDCSYLAKLVATGRLDFSSAKQIAHDLVLEIPRKAFKL